LSTVKTSNHQYDFLLQMLFEYMLRQSIRYENDVIQLSNNVTYRDADPLDHLEMIMAQTRFGTSQKIFDDLRTIIAISRGR
jgi:hypothetical protein